MISQVQNSLSHFFSEWQVFNYDEMMCGLRIVESRLKLGQKWSYITDKGPFVL